jgi:DNA processing protein
MDSIRPWFYLKSVPGVGNLLCKRLIDRFKAPENVFQASDQELLQVNGLTQRHVAAIKYHKPEGVETELALAAKKDYRFVTLTDSNYPRLLPFFVCTRSIGGAFSEPGGCRLAQRDRLWIKYNQRFV